MRDRGRAGERAGTWPGLAPLAAALPRRPAGDPRAWLAASLAEEAEQRRLFPWLAVAFGLGILLYFSADGSPGPWPPLIAALLAADAAWLARRRVVARAGAFALVFLWLGFAAAAWRVQAVQAPAITQVTTTRLTGFVEAVEPRREGARLTLQVHEAERLRPEERPRRVRVTVRGPVAVRPGAFVAAQARLMPPPGAARPGGYDFARDAYFNGLGAVGSVSGKLEERAPPVSPGPGLLFAARVDEARNALTRRIAETIGGAAGAVSAALITGKRGLIEEPANDAMRAAGIYHIVSISGLHMVLAAGTAFWLVRALLALSAQAALLWPVKKIAACFAMAAATAYCIFSGAEVATERSLVMTLVMFGAVLADRPALSLRNLALSALIVLAREPEALLGPSFQMSYAAVAGLIALAEWQRRLRDGGEEPHRPRGLLARGLAEIGGILGTTAVATMATAPFSAYHFQTLNPFGLLGNALALPLMSVVVMPAAVLGTLLYPFGLDAPIWWVMGRAVAAVLGSAEWVSSLEGSVVLVTAFGAGTLALFVLALLLAVLPVSRLRLAAAAPAALGLGFARLAPVPDLFVDREGGAAAIRGREGRLVVVGKASPFVIAQWLRAAGDARRPNDPGLREGSRCDRLGCVVEAVNGHVVAHVLDRRAFAEDCRRATILVSRLRAPAGCAAPLILDRAYLEARGAVSLRLGASGPVVETARDPATVRIWQRPRRPPASQPPAPSRGTEPAAEPEAAIDL